MPPAVSALPAALPLGVAAGLTAALASAISYLVSRHHGNRDGGGSLRLLVLAHAVMGGASLPILWWLWPERWPEDRRWLVPLVGSAICYLAGQAAVFAALKRVPASRLAPLMGLKIAILAAVVSTLPGDRLDPQQWLAVGLCVVAATMLQRGGAIPATGLAIVVVACLAFSVSDLCIVALIDALQDARHASGRPLGRLPAGGLAMAITYVACGAVAVVASALRPRLRPRDRRDCLAAAEYAAAWFGGVVALYACFGLVGAMLGNVLQSTRGVMAILIGAALARGGWHDLEERVDRVTLLRRVAAAILMVAAIAIYVGDPGWGRLP